MKAGRNESGQKSQASLRRRGRFPGSRNARGFAVAQSLRNFAAVEEREEVLRMLNAGSGSASNASAARVLRYSDLVKLLQKSQRIIEQFGSGEVAS